MYQNGVLQHYRAPGVTVSLTNGVVKVGPVLATDPRSHPGVPLLFLCVAQSPLENLDDGYDLVLVKPARLGSTYVGLPGETYIATLGLVCIQTFGPCGTLQGMWTKTAAKS